MMQTDTPMPGEDPGALIEDEDRLDEIELAETQGSEADPRAPERPGATPPGAQ